MSTTASSNVTDRLTASHQKLIDLAQNFTRAYRENIHEHRAIREARCHAEQYPFILSGVRDTDLFAGWQWTYEFLVGFNLELYANWNMEVIAKDSKRDADLTDEERELRSKLTACSGGFFYDYGALHEALARIPEDSELAAEVRDIISFWETESTMYKYNQEISDDVRQALGRVTSSDLRYANSFGSRICCYSLDIDKLLQLGLPGLRELIASRKHESAGDPEATGLFEGMLLTVDVIDSVLDFYLDDVGARIAATEDELRIADLERLAESLAHLKTNAPATMHHAMQLWWLYQIMADVPNYGRMDQWLGDFYVRDLEDGTLTEDEAFALLKNIYQMVTDRRYDGAGSHAMPNSRIILGGRGRRNRENADRFAKLALKVTRAMNVTEPQTTLRVTKGQDPELFEMAMDAIASGAVYPILYNDDVHVPWVKEAYGVTELDAEQYVPEGCGEIMIDHTSLGSPNNIINYLSGLDLVLHNGYDTNIGEQRGLELGEPEDFGTFEQLVEAWKTQVHYTQRMLAKRHVAEITALRKSVSFNFLSMLSNDCVERGKSLFDGGIRYSGGIIESFGLTNVADSLWAIKHVVFERNEMKLRDLVEATDSNFEGYDQLHKQLLDLPKFGNDEDGVDELHRELSNFACKSAYDAGKEAGLDFFLICNLNPGAGYYRQNTKASADGRVNSQPMAYGNNPTAGRDKSGITSLLNSLTKTDHLHSGYVHNVKMSKSLFSDANRGRTRDLIQAYFDNNGCQLMITVVDQEELKAAQREPHKYRDLIVRVAGWNARFVDLAPHEQREIMNRTFYT